jgi:surface antigen
MEIRTTLPEYGSPFYNNASGGGWSLCITGSPTCPGRNVLSNCVGYACGRFNEILGNMWYPKFCCNAEDFTDVANYYELPISPVPTLGGIMVWEGVGSLAGHVAIVERIDNANQIFTSESGWNCDYFWNATRTNDNGNWGMNGNYRFKGCITNPALRSHLQYKGHIQNIGWTDWMDSGQLCGTTGQNLRLEGLKIKSDKYDIYAMAHIQDYGWQDYGLVDENTIIGTEYEAKRIECIKLKIVNKENGNIAGRFKIHMQNYGDSPYTMADGVCTLGSVGQALRIEGITIEEI